jgi:hypothetical protein
MDMTLMGQAVDYAEHHLLPHAAHLRGVVEGEVACEVPQLLPHTAKMLQPIVGVAISARLQIAHLA